MHKKEFIVMKSLLSYDINEKIDPHGLRIRIIRELRRIKAINIQRSIWILPEISEKLRSLLLEAENIGARIIISEYKPTKLHKELITGLVKPSTFKDHEFLMKIREAFIKESLILKEKTYGKSIEYRMPSEAINMLYGEAVDVIILLTDAKSLESAMYVGYEVLDNSLLLRDSTAFTQIAKIEDTNEYMAISWIPIPPKILYIFSSRLKLDIIKGSSPSQERITVKGGFVYRRIFGISPGEEIYVNGIPVAKADSNTIVIVSRKGRIVDVMGSSLNCDKIKELGKIRLETAIVKSFESLS
ncbi:MAG: DUF2117 domain-containing protein [Candidatus Methylarchaceae archaeon HK02M1]|nr:DUF2117 domain-containing protein [Candidatus Methylarchaceae archaeon HK02M1]